VEELLYYSLSTVASYIVDNVSHNLFRSDSVLSAVLTHFISRSFVSSADNEKGCLR